MSDSIEFFPDWAVGESYKGADRIIYEPCPQIMNDLSSFLQERGHECVMIVGAKDHEFKWCQKDICPKKLMHEDMHKRNIEAEQFAEKLKEAGHNCVYIMESYPMQVGWCMNTDGCIKKRKVTGNDNDDDGCIKKRKATGNDNDDDGSDDDKDSDDNDDDSDDNDDDSDDNE